MSLFFYNEIKGETHMEIRVLKNFLVIAQENNISKAAEVLHISQSALSRQILDLEEELGVKLFVRNRRSTELTLDGLRFRERAQSIVDLSEKTMAEFQGNDSVLSGEVGIACEASFETAMLKETIEEVHRLQPEVKFSFIDAATEAAVHYLEEDVVDFAILTEPFNKEIFNYIELPKKKIMGVLLHKDHPLADKGALSAEDLAGIELYVFHSFIKPRFPKRPAVSRGKMRIIGNYTSIHTILPLIKSSSIAALCLRDGTESPIQEDLVFLPIAPQIDFQIVIAYRKFHILSKQAEFFLSQFIRSQENIKNI